MKSSLQIAKRNQLYILIKKVSDHYGGDDVEWLREYAKEIVHKYSNDIDTAIKCFEDLLDQTKLTIGILHNNGTSPENV